MKYFINGSEVSEKTYERDRNDNFNLGIRFVETVSNTECHMDYEDN